MSASEFILIILFLNDGFISNSLASDNLEFFDEVCEAPLPKPIFETKFLFGTIEIPPFFQI